MSEERFKIKFKWKVYNKEFKEITSYSYSYFKFKFKIIDQNIQEEFAELIGREAMLMPWEICNFFLTKGITYSLHFRYLKETSLRANLKILHTVILLKLMHLKLILQRYISFEKQIERKVINGKERKSIMLKIYRPQKMIMYFFQADSNIWWVPKIIRKESELVKITSIGWLFSQIGRCKYLIVKE